MKSKNAISSTATFQNGAWVETGVTLITLNKYSEIDGLSVHVTLERLENGSIRACVTGIDENRVHHYQSMWSSFANDTTIPNDASTLGGVLILFEDFIRDLSSPSHGSKILPENLD